MNRIQKTPSLRCLILSLALGACSIAQQSLTNSLNSGGSEGCGTASTPACSTSGPVITTQPVSATVLSGGPASFSVVASGVAPLTYQWIKDNSNLGSQNSSQFGISTAQSSDAGNYWVVITDSLGQSTKSQSVSLTVTASAIAPVITLQPVSGSALLSSSFTFSVTATGTSLQYQWYNWNGAIVGANQSTYTMASVKTSDTGTYYVVVSSTLSQLAPATSNTVNLTVTTSPVAPSIGTQPMGGTISVNSNFTFTVKASGTSLKYQWYNSTGALTGATQSNYTVVSAQNSDTYYVIVSSSVAGLASVQSNTVSLTVNPVAVIPPGDLYVSPAGNDTSNDGSWAKPFKTIDHARIVARTLLTNMSRDILVDVLPGTYQLTQTLNFSAADSGKNGFTVRWQGVGCNVLVSGGIPISGWTLHDSTHNIWQASVPAGFDTRYFYVNNQRADRARTPEDTTQFSNFTSAGFNTKYAVSGWKNPTRIEAIMRAMIWRMGRCPISNVTSSNGIYSMGLQAPCGSNAVTTQHSNVNYIENAYELLTLFATPGQWYLDPTVNLIYYIPRSGENMATISAVAANVEGLMTLNSVKNISFTGFTFSHSNWKSINSDLGYTDWQGGYHYNLGGGMDVIPGTVQIYASSNVSLSRNFFTHIGGSALRIQGLSGAASTGVQVVGNVFEDISSHAIDVGIGRGVSNSTVGNTVTGLAEAPADPVTNISINDNHIYGVGVEINDANGIFVASGTGVNVNHNVVHSTTYSAIAVGYGWSSTPSSLGGGVGVSANEIYDFMSVGHDGGAVYILSDQSGGQTQSGHTGSLVEQNYIHDDLDPAWNSSDPRGPPANDWGGSIYLDNGSGHVAVDNNVLTNTRHWLYITSGVVTSTDTFSNNWRDSTAFLTSNTPAGIYGDILVTGAWPQAAQNVINNSGLESSYSDLKNLSTLSCGTP